ncbi:DPP IV N-terminal domain-containing protein [Pyxidicoccus parkwayensis]|uniref:DPP IV N-terminal domain-containing protein n=1 Tax=Pyxidicoccus parkwayensis TaxID=2813578 RepID=A0ABX7NTV4_9BACT|nr:S9 family peptidase [Pyxidicoccus parkwaysis]QSQ22158.1 DPP IV N-terminal domain-containing protein [Pyxidicoccus parkwaysis]
MRYLLAALVLLSTSAGAQPKSPPPSAPAEDSFLRQYSETQGFRFGRPGLTAITPDEKTVLFLRAQPPSNAQTLFAFDVATGETRELLTPQALLKGVEETLSPEEKARRERMRLMASGFTSFALSPDGTQLRLGLSGRLYVVERASGKVTELKSGPGAIDPQFSPDGRQVAYVRDNDVYRLDLASQTESRVTRGGTPEKTHGLAEFLAQEEMGRFSGFWWSPDSKLIAYAESDTSQVEQFSIVDVMHPEAGARRFPYPRAGKANAKVRLGLTPATGGKTTWVDWDANKYPYLATVVWPEKGPLTLLVQNRLQTEEQLLAVDAKTGRTRVLLTEKVKDDAWLDLHPPFPEWLPDGSGFLWVTERNGGPELELHNADGALARSLVKPEAGFRAFVRYLATEDTLYFAGGPNPTERYLWRVTKGGAPTRVTSGGPALEGARVSEKGGVLVLYTEGPTRMRHAYVLKSDGSRVGELPSVAKEPPFVPRLEVRQVGKERFWAAIVRPRDFKPGAKLPVIVDVYGGAIATTVHQSMAYTLMWQWMADQGFLVVSFDGRGTPLRGNAWMHAAKYQLGLVTVEDQVAALKALAEEVPEVDLQRVGITGWSNGGYISALAVMTRPDVFKAAVAGALVADWRDYDTHVSERLLGLPDEHPEAYERTSLLTYAKKDAPMGRLLIVHGTADDNVYFFHALKLSDALFRAGKPHELLPLSGFTHMVGDPAVNQRLQERLMRHFKDSLGSVPGTASR